MAGALLASPQAQRAALVFAHAPEAVKRIYIAPDDHTDYMWTADEATYRAAFLAMLDYYLDLADATAGNASEYQSRWNCDGSLWMWEYERNRSAVEFQRLIDRIRDGHITVPLNAVAIVLGGTPAEAVLRGMYYPGRIERRYGLRFYEALAMENQTLSLGLGALWVGAGARYSWKGICGYASNVEDAWDRQHDIYWWQGLDGSRILMKWNSMLGGNQGMGGYAEARDPAAIVDYVSNDPGFRARYPYDVIGCFGKGWDDLQTLTGEFGTVAQQKTDATRQVIVSNELDFFQDFEATYGNAIPTLSASFGNEWELYVASLAEVSARVKRAAEKLRAAEALTTLASLRVPGFMTGREAMRDLAWIDLGLYFEHCWTADGAVGHDARRDWQRRIAGEIEAYIEPLIADAVAALGSLIPNTAANPRFFAFNPLSWTRTDLADFAYAGPTPVHVVDLTSGQEVPSQVVVADGQTWLRILATDLPAVGYKVYEVRSGAGAVFEAAATVNGGIIENPFYQVTVASRGAITGLVDKVRGNRQFVRLIGGRAMNDLGAGSGSLVAENAGPVSVTLKATASSPLSHTSRITLIRNSRRIDIRNEITQNFSDVRTWAFGCELTNPDVWHEEVGAVIRARLTTAGGHYAVTNNRYDWLTLNHFAEIGDGSLGLTLSNADCYFMRLGSSTTGVLDSATPQINVLAGGQVDGTHLGIHNQGNDSYFLQRFALRTRDAYDPVAAMGFALEHQNPLVTGQITGGVGYPEFSGSLLTISNPGVLLWAVKPAEEGINEGIIARVWNLMTSAAAFTLSLAGGPIVSVTHATHLETALAPAALSNGALADTLNGNQMKTYLLTPAPAPAAPADLRARAAGSDMVLEWTHVSDATHYQVWRGTTPHFEPGRPGSRRMPDALPPESGNLVLWTDAAVLGDPATHHFYVVYAVNAAALLSGPSPRVGEFEYQLWPGQAI